MNIIQRQQGFLDRGVQRDLGLPYQYIFLLVSGEMKLSFDQSCRYYNVIKEYEQGVNECICSGANQILGEFRNV